jgi:hypothetical protein
MRVITCKDLKQAVKNFDRSIGGAKKFTKIPITIEAIQLSWVNWNNVCDFVDKEYFGGGVYVMEDGSYTHGSYTKDFIDDGRIGLLIKTLEGTMLAVEGDFIIKGVNGEFYPCKPDIFKKSYIETEKLQNRNRIGNE